MINCLTLFYYCTQSRGRTGTGVNLLVFETSASTDSAIWALPALQASAKVGIIFLIAIFLGFSCAAAW